MNKKIIILIIGVIVLGVLGILLANVFAGPDIARSEITTTEQEFDENSRTTPEPQGNTFNILTPEEKAAAEEASRLAAEARAAVEAASSSASTTEAAADSDNIEEEEA